MASVRWTICFVCLFCVLFFEVRRLSSSNAENTALLVPPDSETSSTDDGSDGVVTGEESATETSGSSIFVPTSEWKRIEPGQAIPRGLHVRVNLATGEKEAKRMDDDKDEKDDVENDRTINGGSKKSFTKAKLKETLKKLDADADDAQKYVKEETTDKKLRSYEELKKELADLRFDVKSDLEILTELVTQFNQSHTTKERKLAILEDLEYMVHQVDNAQNFVDMGGFAMLSTLLNGTDPEFRQWAAFVVGSATQSNPKVQVAAYENGLLHNLIRVFQLEEQSSVARRKYLFAVSAILRHFPFAQRKFYELGGFEVLRYALQRRINTADENERLKIVTLISDLLNERLEIEDRAKHNDGSPSPIQHKSDLLSKLRQYRDVPLSEVLVDGGWCRSIGDLLATPNLDGQEKVLRAIDVMFTDCRVEFQRAAVADRLRNLEETYRSNLTADMDNEFYETLVTLVSEVSGKFDETNAAAKKEEL